MSMSGTIKETPGGSVRSSSQLLKSLVDDFMSLTKARLSILVVFTTAFGYLVATRGAGNFSWMIFFHTVFGTVLAAFGAAVFNQLMEVDADAKMTRTADRPLPSNRMPRGLAFVAGWLFSAFGIIHLMLMTEPLAGAVAAATLAVYLFVYTPMKRYSSWNTIVGAVSGALPPLIGWAAGGGPMLSVGALFLFALLFFWQLPHFAAINWMYREEYEKGGFKMWSNGDSTGSKTARIAVFFSVCVVAVGLVFGFFDIMAGWFSVAGGLLGLGMLWLALRFLKTTERKDARTLFFYTLLYLPAAMLVSYLAWRS